MLRNHFQSCSGNATNRSKTTQNELINYCRKHILERLLAKIKKAKILSVAADEVADVSNKEQMPLVIRYVDQGGSITEDFLKFIYLESGTAGSTIAERIKKELQELGLDMNNCRGQGYDGASNMAGRYNGAAALIRSEFPLAILHTLCITLVEPLCCRGMQNSYD